MIFTPLPSQDVPDNWPWLSELLQPAVMPDPNMTMQGLYTRLVNGPDLVMIASGTASGALVFEITEDRVCWLKYLAGSVCGGPKERVMHMQQAMAEIERSAANAGCSEIRLCGRNWSQILLSTGYQLIEGEQPNLLVKELAMKEAA